MNDVKKQCVRDVILNYCFDLHMQEGRDRCVEELKRIEGLSVSGIEVMNEVYVFHLLDSDLTTYKVEVFLDQIDFQEMGDNCNV